MLKHAFFTILLFLGSLPAAAGTSWIPMTASDDSCSTSCGRSGLETVLAPKGGSSVCAVEYEQEAYPGTFAPGRSQSCRAQIGADKKLVFGKPETTHCLCAADGSNRGSDYAWITSARQALDCSEVCNETGPKYMYAVYASQTQNWLHVCASGAGEIGYTGPEKPQDCQVEPSAQAFGCLCTQMFSGDLDPQEDP